MITEDQLTSRQYSVEIFRGTKWYAYTAKVLIQHGHIGCPYCGTRSTGELVNPCNTPLYHRKYTKYECGVMAAVGDGSVYVVSGQTSLCISIIEATASDEDTI